LHNVSDRNGWWNLYDESGIALCPLDAEFGVPDWAFGAATYAFLADGRVIAVWADNGEHHLGFVSDGRAVALEQPFSAYSEVQPAGTDVIALAASPTLPATLVRFDLAGAVDVLRRSQEVQLDADTISAPEAVDFPTGAGEVSHALFYPPVNPQFRAP
jgi:dipeptidyl aminopeptidase/acylaminoacyl peptidase